MGFEGYRQVRPAVMHGLREWAWGAPPAHVLYQTAAIGYYLGQGQPPAQAIGSVEQAEALPGHWQHRPVSGAERAEMGQLMGWSQTDWM